ncbi:MAG: hypothetical protein HZB56_00595 [Deltaproteobacteria bacterium]|nr:hypothetical protein [Deltaproteobacteria bacterium]
MVDAAHARYVVLYHHLRNAIDSANFAALEALAGQLRALPRGDERRAACLALHHAAAGIPVRARQHFEQLLEEAFQEQEEEEIEIYMRLRDAWYSLESRRQ